MRAKRIPGLRRRWLLFTLLAGVSVLLYVGLSPGGKLRDGVVRFVDDVQSGLAVARSAADSGESGGRLSGGRTSPMEGHELWATGAALAIGTLISEDLTCIAAGLLVAQKVLPFWAATLACLVGIVVGDILLLLAGRGLRRMAWESSWVRVFVRPEAIQHGEHWIERKGPVVALISRFTPGTRLATYLAAGLLGVSIFRFSVYFLIAAGLWTPILVGLSTLFGSAMMEFWTGYERYALVALLMIALGLFGLFKVGLPLLTRRGRRLLWSRYQRAIRWEFWPPWVFYPPVVAYILWLGIRFRHPTLFTAVNPGMPQSGFLGESKSEILAGLREAGESVARWRLLPASENVECRMKELVDFMNANRLGFPIVLKPDVGQRGEGVVIAKSPEEARSALESAPQALIAQAYIEGPEFGVFYVRRPSEPRGSIISITEKRRLWLTGDGVRTVEELILDDERAVCMARFHLRKHAARLDEVPGPGEAFPLVEVGAHCRGSLFLDGKRIQTAELEAAVDRIAHCSPEFYFGRFDFRAPSEDDFCRGMRLKVLELNGVTSEATHIYDPANSLWMAYRTLFTQWRLAFEIAAENRARGHPATSVLGLGRLVLAAWKEKGRTADRRRRFPAGSMDSPVDNPGESRAESH
ncbi:MAG: VTT domain-containing protein [Opitutaceae bacterium]